MDAAVADEDAQARHSQPTYPPIPAHELYGRMLYDAGRYDAAIAEFQTALKQYPNRALATLGLARTERAAGNRAEAVRYEAAFTTMWAHADPPELAAALAVR
jgi:tetratricopeptide (TPR) repeat protein